MQSSKQTIPTGSVPSTEGQPPKNFGQTSSAVSTYRREQLLNLSAVEVIKRLYDFAILGCKKNDTSLSQKALNELIAALNFDHSEIALGLFRLYEYCKRCIRQNKVNEAVGILEELRAVWAEAFHL